MDEEYRLTDEEKARLLTSKANRVCWLENADYAWEQVRQCKHESYDYDCTFHTFTCEKCGVVVSEKLLLHYSKRRNKD